MPFFRRKNSYEALPSSETQPLIVGINEQARHKRCRRRCCHFFFALIVLIFIGHGVFAYMYTRSRVECVPYEGGTTVVKLPIFYPRSVVLVDSSISSRDVAITHVEGNSNEITFTMEEDNQTLESSTDVRVCTLKGGKLTGLGLHAGKGHGDLALPVIKSLKIEIPASAPTHSIDILTPRRGCHDKTVEFLKWMGIWKTESAGTAMIEAAGTSESS